ncbi:hypothetical protein Godav_018169 [Gossypium davidsonii]|uniref:RNase H type-1 domain-containing protein n=1 Tax=Gossypium davidsonii TaxID=34287 RepID=A0A7J8QVT7_GOSDV|nr:hypothetical protein [Gossypium davidsonii]
MKLDSRLASVGGALRDRYGGWIIGYNKNLGRCFVLNAESWGILDGLKISKDQNYDGVSIKTDNKDAIEAIHESFSKTSLSALIRHIQQNLMDIGKWKLEYISREMNLKAHFIVSELLIEMRVFN